MSIRVRRYCKRLGFIVAGVLLGTSLGLSSVASGVVLRPGGVIGFNPAGRGFNRAGPNFPAFNRAGMNVPTLNTPAGQPIVASKSLERPVINQIDVNGENPCAAAEEAALIFIN